MGKICSKQSQMVNTSFLPSDPEIAVISYKSDSDKYFETIENKFNYFRKILFIDYLHSLVNFSSENATLDDSYDKVTLEYSMNDTFFSEIFSVDSFQSFIENKILRYGALYEEAGSNEKATSIFKEGFLEIFKGLGLKLSQDAKSKGNENADKNNIIKKGEAMALGILYCIGPNSNKIRALFNIFQQDGVVKTSEKLSELFLSLFLIPSYGVISARNKLQKFNEVGAIEKEKLKELLDSAELKDSQNLINVTNKLLFGDDLSGALNFDQWKEKFEEKEKDKSLAFLLSPSGVRYMLKAHNV